MDLMLNKWLITIRINDDLVNWRKYTSQDLDDLTSLSSQLHNKYYRNGVIHSLAIRAIPILATRVPLYKINLILIP